VGDSDGRLALEQQHRDRLADDVRLADHHRVEAFEVVDHRLEQHHYPERGAGHDSAGAGREAADVDRVEAVDVLARRDGAQHQAGVDVRRQRHLHEDAVDLRIGVEPGDERQQLVLRGLGRQTMLEALDPDFGAFLDLAADIHFARRIASHEDYRQARARRTGGDHSLDRRPGFVVELAGDRAPVDHLGHQCFAS
jgi:hypothetical protein